MPVPFLFPISGNASNVCTNSCFQNLGHVPGDYGTDAVFNLKKNSRNLEVLLNACHRLIADNSEESQSQP